MSAYAETTFYDVSRRRLAMVLVCVGLALILTGSAMVLYTQQAEAPTEPPTVETTPAEQLKQANAIKWLLFLLIVLIGIFAVSTIAFLRFSRRFRRFIMHKPSPPSPTDDLWSKHRLPRELESVYAPETDEPADDSDDSEYPPR